MPEIQNLATSFQQIDYLYIFTKKSTKLQTQHHIQHQLKKYSKQKNKTNKMTIFHIDLPQGYKIYIRWDL